LGTNTRTFKRTENVLNISTFGPRIGNFTIEI